MEEHDVVVVGGGPIGLASAWRTSQRGLDVVVLERDRAGSGASSVAAGLLAPVTEAEPGEDAFVRLALDSLARWPAFAAELERDSGIDVGFLACGTLAVALDRDDAEELERVFALHQRLGLESRRLLPSEARALEPGLSPRLAAAFLAETECAVDPRRVTAALAAALGDRLVEGAEVVRTLVEDGRVAGVEARDGRAFRARTVVAAGGAWGSDWLPLEAVPPVRPVKGEVLILRGEAPVSRSVRTVGPHHVYLVPRGDGRLVVGATMLERGDTTVTAGGVLELLREAYRALPEIAELELLEARASLRPAAPSSLPLVGPGALPGLAVATGHHRNGILLTPHTADAVAELVAA